VGLGPLGSLETSVAKKKSIVIPAEAGIHLDLASASKMDSSFRWNDEQWDAA
jgi:hypothetical protein